MKILIIDSCGSEPSEDSITIHSKNSLILAKELGADLYMCGENDIEKCDSNYDRVIFVHSSSYVKVSPIVDFLLKQNPKYFYICNEYNLGQAVPLWALSVKHGKSYEVIANHYQKANKRLKAEKPITNWHFVNLNTLIYEPRTKKESLFEVKKNNVVYFGTFRKGRIKYFKKYFVGDGLCVSTSNKNILKFVQEGVTKARFIKPLNWSGNNFSLSDFKSTLYLEDEHTHDNFNCLSNRFYEALSYNVPMFFDISCENTIVESGYDIDNFWFVDSYEELIKKTEDLKEDFVYPKQIHDRASYEKSENLNKIKEIIFQ